MAKRITLIFLLLFVSVLINAQAKRRPDVLIKSSQFIIHYSEVYEQPLSVEYSVECTVSKFSRAGLDFFTCDSVITSDAEDYANNEWDKGHMAPAADFACNEALLKGTFTYLNCALQNDKLNRGVWRFLEAREREMALTGPVKVRIDIHFSKSSKKLLTGATVPDGFTKTITKGKLKEVYYFPNAVPDKRTYKEYQK